MNPTTPTITNPVSKPSLWPTLIWLQYLWILLPLIASLFIFINLKATNPTDTITTDGVSVNINQVLIFAGIQVIIYLVLLILCLKKKKVTLKTLPVLEALLYISFAISNVLFFRLNSMHMNALAVPLLLNLVRPAIVIFILFKNKESYIQ